LKRVQENTAQIVSSKSQTFALERRRYQGNRNRQWTHHTQIHHIG